MLIDGYASFERIGRLLGLDVVNDKAERTILSKALNGLRSFKAIEGDDDYITLTEAGKVYADKGERPDTYQKTFDIFIDKDHVEWKSVKNALSAVIEHIATKSPTFRSGIFLAFLPSFPYTDNIPK